MAGLAVFLEDRGGSVGEFAGLKKQADRAAVIVYLRSLSDSPKPLP